MGAKFNKDILMRYTITRGTFQLLLDIEKSYNDKDSRMFLKKAYKLVEEIKRGDQIKDQYYDSVASKDNKSLKDYIRNTIICITSTESSSDQAFATDYGLIISRFKQQGMINSEAYENLCNTIAKTFNVIRKEGTYNGDALPTVFEMED